ncbi:type II secretion system F family protein [Arthrobacter sp. MDT2-16]
MVALLLAGSGVILSLSRAAPTGSRPAGRARAPAGEGLRGPLSSRMPGHGGTRARYGGRRTAVDPHELPLFVHQLAGLLRAGRPPHTLWADMESVYADRRSTFAVEALPVIGTARRAAELGLGIPDALRQATGGTGLAGAGRTRVQTDRLWVDLAGCLVVAERSGAPLAGILERYAAQLDADLEGLSARETALAGPRATVVLLAWLPAVGLFLGFALGLNPLEVLLGSFLGRLAFAAGLLLMIVSRIWSGALVRRAGGDP